MRRLPPEPPLPPLPRASCIFWRGSSLSSRSSFHPPRIEVRGVTGGFCTCGLAAGGGASVGCVGGKGPGGACARSNPGDTRHATPRTATIAMRIAGFCEFFLIAVWTCRTQLIPDSTAESSRKERCWNGSNRPCTANRQISSLLLIRGDFEAKVCLARKKQDLRPTLSRSSKSASYSGGWIQGLRAVARGSSASAPSSRKRAARCR